MKRVVSIVISLLFIQNIKANECGHFLSGLTSPVCTDAKYIFWTGAGITLGLRLLKQYKGFDEIQELAV